MTPTELYIKECDRLVNVVAGQKENISLAASWFAETILANRLVHLFGSGHSRIMVEEMWPRYGSFPGFHPIVELSLTNHTQVVGANGQRQAMFLENVEGFAAKILRNFSLSPLDTALVVSSSGCNIVQIEMAELFQQQGIKVVALISKLHSEASESKRKDGKKLSDFADIVLDTGAPVGDAMIKIKNLDTPVSPGSTVGGVMIVNCLKAEVANILTERGKPPYVLTASALIGKERSTEIFDKAYDEYGNKLSELYKRN